jgi:hypothetical protein
MVRIVWIGMTWLLGRAIWLFAGAMTDKGLDDPVYKNDLQKLIGRHRQFEDDNG